MKMIKKTVDELFEKYEKLVDEIREKSMEIFPREIIDSISEDSTSKTIRINGCQINLVIVGFTGSDALRIHCRYADDRLNYTQFIVGSKTAINNGLDIVFGATSGLEILRNYHLRNPIVSEQPVYYWNYDQISIKEIADFAAKIEHIKAMWTLVCINSDEILKRMKEDNHE